MDFPWGPLGLTSAFPFNLYITLLYTSYESIPPRIFIHLQGVTCHALTHLVPNTWNVSLNNFVYLNPNLQSSTQKLLLISLQKLSDFLTEILFISSWNSSFNSYHILFFPLTSKKSFINCICSHIICHIKFVILCCCYHCWLAIYL